MEALRVERAAVETRARRRHRDTVQGAGLVALIGVLFAGIAIYNALVHGRATAAALFGVVVFGVIASVIWRRRNERFPSEEAPLARLTRQLETNRVWVADIVADAAIEVCRATDEADVFGYVLQVGPDEIAYMPLNECVDVAFDQLPSSSLTCRSAVPARERQTFHVEARGDRLVPVRRLALEDERAIYDQVPTAWTPYRGKLSALASRL